MSDKKQKAKRKTNPPKAKAVSNVQAKVTQEQLDSVTKQFTQALGQLWKNQQEIKAGMDAAEFNLRAHQKVLNSIAMTMLGGESSLVYSDSRVDWPYYHTQVEEELKAIMEEEKRKAADKEKLLVMEERVKALTEAAKEAGNDPVEVQAEVEKLLAQSKKLFDELGKAMRGEPYDVTVIADAEKFIAESEAKKGGSLSAPGIEDGVTVFGG